MKEGPKFLTPKQIEEKAKVWKSDAAIWEDQRYGYMAADRVESNTEYNDSVAELHGIPFIREVIPRLILEKKKGEKVKILDIGAGAAFFADEIRTAFPDSVKVFSTGLNKRTAKDYRKKNKPTHEYAIHPNDLKWRSVSELSDFPEFDLIIDTYGEFTYTIFPNQETLLEDEEKALQYLTMLIKKLKPGGLASIASESQISDLWPLDQSKLRDLEKKYNVKITIPENPENVLRIEKNKNEWV